MRIVIAGGGFAGVRAALQLSKKGVKNITLVSDQDYFLHHATLYATATGRSRKESVVPLKDIFAEHPQVTVINDRAVSVDATRKLLVGEKKSYPYDSLIVALGVVTSYFNIDGLANYSFGIKTLPEVEIFRNHLCQVIKTDEHSHKNYVIVGAGPTGVELAAAIREYINEVCGRHNPKNIKLDITLIEAAPRILPRMSEAASSEVQRRLERLDVTVLTGQKVESRTKDDVIINGKALHSDTVIWTSGVTNHSFFAKNKALFNFAKNGRVEVDDYLQAAPDIYVIGDNANTAYTGTAYTALHNADYIASYLAGRIRGELIIPYRPKLFATTVPVGDDWAIFERRSLRVTGWLGARIRRLTELRDYLYLIPFPSAWKAWRSHYTWDDEMLEKPKA